MTRPARYTRGVRCFLPLATIALFAACDPVRTTATPVRAAEAWRGNVRIVAHAPTTGVEELGAVRAVGTDLELTEVMHGFVDEVGKLGGNLAVVDRIETKFELLYTTQVSSYGGMKTVSSAPRERATTAIIGRAFRK